MALKLSASASASSKRSSKADFKKILKTIKLAPDVALTFNYYGKITMELKEELVINNPTERIVAFRLKSSTPRIIKLIPNCGYLKPNGRVTIWVSIFFCIFLSKMLNFYFQVVVKPLPDGKPPIKQHIAVFMSLAPQVYPANPMDYWKDKSLSKNYRRKPIKLTFVALEKPPAPIKGQSTWVDKIKKKKDDEDSFGCDSDDEDSEKCNDQ